MKLFVFRILAATGLLLCSARAFAQVSDSFRLEFAPVFGLAPSGSPVFSRDYTSSGPATGARLIPGMKVVANNTRSKLYSIFYHEFHEIDVASGGIKQITFPDGLSWPTGLTIDHQRNRVLISAATPNAAGGIYAFDLEDRSWTLLVDHLPKLDSILLDPQTNILWGYTEHHSIVQMDRDGKSLRELEQLNIPFQLGPSQHVSELALIAAGKIALLLEPEFSWPQSWLGEQRIYILGDGPARLTFEKKHDGWPPAAVAPNVRITSPAPGEKLNSGDRLVIKVQADDPDGSIEQVRLYAGQEFLADIKRSGDGEFVFDLIPFGPGSHRIHAQASDSDGFISNSGDTTFSIQNGPAEEPTFSLSFWPTHGLTVQDGRIIGRNYASSGPRNGPTLFAGMHVVADSSEETIYYGTHWHEVYRIDPQTGKPRQMIVSGVPDVSWTTGVAWDGMRSRLLLMTLGGEGYLYAYSPHEDEWSVVANMENTDYFAVAYSYDDDSIYAVSQTEIVKFNSEGKKLASMPNPSGLPLTPGGYDAKLVIDGNRMWMLMEPDHISSGGPGSESCIYEIDFANRQFTRTYRKVWRTWPPQNTAPTVTIRSPGPGGTLDNHATIVLEALVTDQDNDVHRVEFFANGQSLGVARDTGQSGIQKIFSFEWNNAPVGPVQLRARVTDSEGLSSQSATVTFTVGGSTPDRLFTIDFFKFLDGAGSSVVTRRYIPEGPLDDLFLFPGTRIISADDVFYGVNAPYTLFRVNQATGLGEEVSLAGLRPEVRGPVSVAYDSRRDRLVLASMGGEGFLYAYSLQNNAWTGLQNLDDRELVSLHYHFPDDSLYGLAQSGHNPGAGPVIFQFDSTGKEIGYISLPKLPFTLGQYGYTGEVTSSGDLLVVLLEFRAPGMHHIQESRIYTVDPRYGSVRLTYRKVWDDIPPGIPVVTMLKPSAGDKLFVGLLTTLEAAASAGYSGLAEFEFLVNGQSIGPAQRGSDAASVSLGQFEWVPENQGTFAITAKVRTWEGSVALSAPVTVTVGPAPVPLITALRELPEWVSSGQNFTVAISVAPSERVNAYALEDRPPHGWRVSNISHDGVFDPATGLIKFGPYSDRESRTVTYIVTATANAPAHALFSGTVSANSTLVTISGDGEVQVGPGHHPADRGPADFTIRLQEATSYASAWKAGDDWPIGPTPIPIEYVTRAAMIWRQGEKYRFDSESGIAPYCWVPSTDPQAIPVRAAAQGVDPVLRRISQGAENTFEITLHLPALGSSSALAIEEKLPSGAVVTNVSEGGSFDRDSGAIRWGPWTGSRPASVRYSVQVSGGDASGTFSIDGNRLETTGDHSFVFVTVTATAAGFELRFPALSDATITVERADTISGPWSQVRSTSGTAIIVPEGKAGFFRLRTE